MRKIILMSFLLFSNPAFALYDHAYDILQGHGAFYFYGDDGVECGATIFITGVGPLKGSKFNVTYEASQHYSDYGCEAYTIKCKAEIDLQEKEVSPDSLSCDY